MAVILVVEDDFYPRICRDNDPRLRSSDSVGQRRASAGSSSLVRPDRRAFHRRLFAAEVTWRLRLGARPLLRPMLRILARASRDGFAACCSQPNTSCPSPIPRPAELSVQNLLANDRLSDRIDEEKVRNRDLRSRHCRDRPQRADHSRPEPEHHLGNRAFYQTFRTSAMKPGLSHLCAGNRQWDIPRCSLLESVIPIASVEGFRWNMIFHHRPAHHAGQRPQDIPAGRK